MGYGRFWVVLLALAVWSATAHADGGVLILPTQLAGNVPDRAGWQREFDARLERAVEKSGLATQAPGPLTATEAACRTADCMARIADASGASIVIGARVSADHGSPPSYKIVVTRFTRAQSTAVRQEEAECSVCTETETAERLEQIATSLLPTPVVPTPVVTPPVAIVETSPPPPAPPPTKLYAALGVTSAIAVGGIVMLGVGGRALAIDGKLSGGITDGKLDRYNTHSLGAGLVGGGVVIAVAAVIGIIAESVMLKRARR